jgi:hypothetical protein
MNKNIRRRTDNLSANQGKVWFASLKSETVGYGP